MDFYAKFPLVILEQEDHLTWSKSDNVKGKSKATASMQLWVIILQILPFQRILNWEIQS